MTLYLDKQAFKGAVGSVARFAERRSGSLPVLAGIALIAGDDGIKLRATNLETGIDLRVEGTIEEAGVVVLPANVLRDITSSMSGSGKLTLEHAGETVVISQGNAKSTLKTLPSEDFPILPLPDAPTSEFTLPGAVLSNLISSVVSFASTSTVRPELASVFLSAEGGTLKAVATDSFRLAEKKLSLNSSIPPFSMLIPAKNALDIIQTLPDTDIKVALDEHQCVMTWEGGLVTTRLVAASYPDYAQIIPKSFIAEASLIKKDFETALRRTSVFSDTFQKVRLGLDAGGKKTRLSAQNADIGETSEEVAGAVSGDSVELSFNHRYLSAPLSIISAESITLSASGIGRALVMRGSGDNSFLYLVMPMNQ
jgi:DNA polymerase III subunit beta